MNLRIVDLPGIAVIGMEGLCTPGHNIVSELWQQANARFGEVAALAMKEKDGSLVGFWGAMSDESRAFMPWTENFQRGLYLAGVEVYKDAAAPEGWTRWVMPARKYLAVEVTPGQYGEIFSEVLAKTLPEMGYALAGAVCDHTKPATGQDYLFFPVKARGE
ncbi:MAG: AraC family transcriptional regulator [Clostridiales bacterium]|nr:AraC family transcriptional regulator [Clostridiales bacterium]